MDILKEAICKRSWIANGYTLKWGLHYFYYRAPWGFINLYDSDKKLIDEIPADLFEAIFAPEGTDEWREMRLNQLLK
jgi:hypothetical protein